MSLALRDRRVVLLGLRGVGKTTVGELAASLLGLPWIDSDQEIARRHAAPAELVASGRIDELRAAEESVVAEFSRERGALLSLGGGAIESALVRSALRPWRAVLLDAPDAELARRIEADRAPRPPLTDLPLLAEIRLLRARRFALYTALDPMIIATAGREPREIAAEIRDRLVAESAAASGSAPGKERRDARGSAGGIEMDDKARGSATDPRGHGGEGRG